MTMLYTEVAATIVKMITATAKTPCLLDVTECCTMGAMGQRDTLPCRK